MQDSTGAADPLTNPGATATRQLRTPGESMKIHEHIIQINPAGDSRRLALTRAQIWAGLVLRAEDPMQFILGLERGVVLERIEADGRIELARELDFGGFTVRDRVHLRPETESRTEVAASERWPASSMTIRIEEPATGQFFLRFTYESNEPEPQSEIDTMSLALRRQAYEKADFDTAQTIRQLAEQGLLDD